LPSITISDEVIARLTFLCPPIAMPTFAAARTVLISVHNLLFYIAFISQVLREKGLFDMIKIIKAIKLWIIFFFICLSVSNLFASESDGDNHLLLEPVVIRATDLEKIPLEVPNSVDIIDLENNQAVTIFRTVPEALKYMPGVMIQKTGHGQGSPFIRGFTGFRTLYLIDGIRLNNSVFRDGPNQYLNSVDSFSLSKIEVVKGPSSVLYGSGAIGGTVNLISRSNSHTETGAHFYPSTFYRFSTAENSHVGHVEIVGNYDDKFGILLGLTYKNYGDLVGGDLVGEQEKTGYEELDFNFKFDYSLTRDSKITIAHQNVDVDNAWRTHKTVYGIAWHGTTFGDEKKRVLDQRRDLSYLKYTGKNFNTVFDNLNINFSFQQQDEERFRVKADGRQEFQGFNVDTIGFSMQADKLTKIGKWVYGIEFYRDEVSSFKTNFNADGSFKSNEIQGPIADDAYYHLFDAYIQHEYALLNRLDMILGGRFTYAEVDAQKIKDALTGKTTSFSDNWNNLAGSLRFLFHVDENNHWKMFSGVSQGFRVPNLSDLTRLDSARSNEVETAALGLDTEQYISYEIGLKAEYERLTMQMAYFYTDVEDMIIRQPTGNVIDGENEITKVNSGNGYIQGVEFSSNYRFNNQFSTFISASWIEGYVETFPSSNTVKAVEPVDRLMPITANLGLKWQSLNQHYWIEGLLTIVDRQDKLSTRDKTDTDRIPPDGTPGYVVYNMRAGWTTNKIVDLTFALENIADKDYRVHGSGINEPGRNFILGVEMKF